MDRLILKGITMSEFVKEVKRRHAKSPADVSSVLFSMVDSRIQDALDITRNNVDEILADIPNKWTVNESTDNFFVPGHEGYWYVIDSTEYRGHRFYLMEHEEYGDDAACVAAWIRMELLWPKTYGMGSTRTLKMPQMNIYRKIPLPVLG